MQIRIGTFNILNTSCRYAERKALLKETIKSMNCDILGLQEVNLSAHPELFDLTTYHLCFAPLPEPMLKKIEPEFRIDGNALLINKSWEAVQELRLVYSTNDRVAQILKLRKENYELLVVNTHLDHLSDSVREGQVKELLEYLKRIEFDACVIMGDFNFLPESVAYEKMRQEMESVCLKVLGKEPQVTFPTGLIGEFADVDEYGCFDYIWVKGKLTALRCQVVRDCGSKSLWASDHYPLYADVQLD